MKNLRVVFAAGAILAASGLANAQDNWTEQYFGAKWGRSSPREEARQKARQANSAWREEPSVEPGRYDDTEQYFRAKYGRSSPAEEARRKSIHATSAWREEPSDGVVSHGETWTEQYFRAKYGRNSGMEEAQRKVGISPEHKK
jgi:hypothetical protein